MREYSKITPQFWLGSTGKKLRGHIEAQVVATYLLTSPHANMLGLYYLPKMFIAHETGLPLEGASKGLQRCIEVGFCHYDEDSEMVWVIEMALHQVGELKSTDNRCAGIQNEYDKLPKNLYLTEFYNKYSSIFHMKKLRDCTSPLQAPCKPLRSQEQEQEQEYNNNIQPTAQNEQQRVDELTRDTRKMFAIGFDWQPNKQQFAAYCLRKNLQPNQLTKEILGRFVDKVSAKGESKTEAQWCENLASYLKSCIDNPIKQKPQQQARNDEFIVTPLEPIRPMPKVKLTPEQRAEQDRLMAELIQKTKMGL